VVVNFFNRLLKRLVKCCWLSLVCHPPCPVSKGINVMIETVCGLKKMCKCDTEQIKLDNPCVSLSEVWYILIFIINILYVRKSLSVFYIDDRGSRLPRNSLVCPPNCTASCLRRSYSSSETVSLCNEIEPLFPSMCVEDVKSPGPCPEFRFVSYSLHWYGLMGYLLHCSLHDFSKTAR